MEISIFLNIGGCNLRDTNEKQLFQIRIAMTNIFEDRLLVWEFKQGNTEA